MNDLMGMHIVTSTNELHHKESSLGLGKATTTTEHIHKGTTSAQLQCHVDICVVFKTFLKADNVRVLKGLVNLDFCVQLDAC